MRIQKFLVNNREMADTIPKEDVVWNVENRIEINPMTVPQKYLLEVPEDRYNGNLGILQTMLDYNDIKPKGNFIIAYDHFANKYFLVAKSSADPAGIYSYLQQEAKVKARKSVRKQPSGPKAPPIPPKPKGHPPIPEKPRLLKPGARSVPNIGTLTDRFEILKLLGSGGYGKVYKVREKKTNKIYALKKYKDDLEDPRSIQMYSIVNTLKQDGKCYKYINCYYEIFYAEEKGIVKLYILMEYIEGMDMYDFMAQLKQPLAEEQIEIFMKHILSALDYIHSKGLAHLDVKPENVLYTKDRLVLIDFDFLCFIDPTRIGRCDDLYGTPVYRSPEMLMKKDNVIKDFPSRDAYSKSDIWAAGILFYEIITGKPIKDDILEKYFEPIADMSSTSFDVAIKKLTPDMLPRLQNPLSLAFIVNTMLTADYRIRPTAKALLDILNSTS